MLSYFYLVLSGLGLVLTWYFNIQFMQAGGGLLEFIRAPSVNAATQSLANDLLIATTAGCVWMTAEGRRLGWKHTWIFTLLSFVIAFAFAFPLFLFVREQHVRKT